jgi:hypothetical protein
VLSVFDQLNSITKSRSLDASIKSHNEDLAKDLFKLGVRSALQPDEQAFLVNSLHH